MGRFTVAISGAACVAVLAVPLAGQQDPAGPAPGAAVERSFEDFISEVRAEAIGRGLKEAVVTAALADVAPLPVVIERDRTQAESRLAFETYLKQRLTARTVRTGRTMAATHRELLDRVSSAYGVPGRILVAIWGVESNYGRFTGIRPTISALATLAFDGRRAAFFRNELFDALTILDRGDIERERLKGSWAGAMGQPQFMPSSYLKYAEDFDRDGRRDIWASNADVFASIANYLKGYGWTAGEPWGRRVQVPKAAADRIRKTVSQRSGGCRATQDMYGVLPSTRWRELGVRSSNGGALARSEMAASLVLIGRSSFLVYRNYDALLGYNCAHPYALSLGLLADQIGTAAPRAQTKPRARAPQRRRG